jgi:hypothetical protein
MAKLDLKKVKTAKQPSGLATVAEVDKLEKKLGTTLPSGYRDYVTTLGDGVLSDCVRVYPPKQIDRELKEWRKRIKQYWFWDEPSVLLKQARAVECIVIADTMEGDEVVFHSSEPKRLYVLPRNEERVFDAGKDLLEAVEWLLGSGKLGPKVKERKFLSTADWKNRQSGEEEAPAKPAKAKETTAEPGKTFLFSCQESDVKGNVKCLLYFLTNQHTRTSWDGKGPLKCDLGKIVQAEQKHAKKSLVSDISILRDEFNNKPYYLATVNFPIREESASVVLDLEGNVIEPEVHKFKDYKEANDFMTQFHKKKGT